MSDVSGQEMVCHFIEFLNALYMGPHNGFFLFKNPDVSVNLCIAKLVVVKVPQSSWNLIFPLVVKKYEKGSCVVIDFKLCAHWLLHSTNQPSSQDNIVYGLTFKFTHIVWSWLGVHDHSDCDWCENFGFSGFLLLSALAAKAWTLVVVDLLRIEKSSWVWKHLKR